MRSLLFLFLLVPGLALGQDEDLLGDDPDEEEEDAPERLDEDDDIDFGDDESMDDFDLNEDEEEDDDDLLSEDEDEGLGTEVTGADNAALFKAQQKKNEDLATDEQVREWELYLERYPNSVFRDRIEKIMESLMEGLFEEGIREEKVERIDANKDEIRLSQGLQLDNVNPRTRLQLGFEWGLPSFQNFVLDYEQQVIRTLSFHGGVRNRYSGWNVEAGPRWAFVKSARTNTIVSLIGDVRFNTIPSFLGIRPQLGVGKRFGDSLDLVASAGVDLELRRQAGVRTVGGLGLTYLASERVAAFAESSLYFKSLSGVGTFQFNTFSFGMKFFPKNKSAKEEGSIEVNTGASVPYATQYLGYHNGSIMGQANLYLDDF